MTDWRKQARAHEESANEYARMNYKLETINADLLEALKGVAAWDTVKENIHTPEAYHREYCYICGNHKSCGHHPACFIPQVAKAIRKAEERS